MKYEVKNDLSEPFYTIAKKMTELFGAGGIDVPMYWGWDFSSKVGICQNALDAATRNYRWFYSTKTRTIYFRDEIDSFYAKLLK